MSHASHVSEALESAEALQDQKAETTRARYNLSPDQRFVIDGLSALQRDMKVRGKAISDGEFSKKLGLGSPSRWSLIRSGDYFNSVKDVGIIFVQLRRSLERFKANFQYGSRFEGKEFVSNPVCDAVFSAVEECMEKPISDRRRIIVYTAETGGGKSMLAWQLQRRYGAIVNNANAGWKGVSGWKALIQICASLNFCVAGTANRATLENNVLTELQSEPYLIVIDEAEYFGKGIIDSMKRFINESRSVLVLLAIRAAYERWNITYPMEGSQLQMRTHGIYDQVLTADMAEPFLARLTWSSDEDRLACGQTAITRAGLLGAFDLIDCTIGRLQKYKGAVDKRRFMAALADECARIGFRETTRCGKG